LIKCNAKDDCSVQPYKENGYYLNTSAASYTQNYIVCDDDGCNNEVGVVSITATDCTSNAYKIIYNSGETQYKFCKDSSSSPQSITGVSPNYFLISGSFAPGKYLNYPTKLGEEGKTVSRSIIVKTDAYTVTAMYDDELPVGYLKNADGTYIECDYTEDGKKVCAEAEVKEVDAEHACETIGELYKIGASGNIQMCLDNAVTPKVALTLNSDNNNKYVISLGSDKGLFGVTGRSDNGYYLVIDVDELGNVTLVKDSSLYKYTDSRATAANKYKIYPKEDITVADQATDRICATGDITAYEYRLVPSTVESGANMEVDYYVVGDNTSQV